MEKPIESGFFLTIGPPEITANIEIKQFYHASRPKTLLSKKITMNHYRT